MNKKFENSNYSIYKSIDLFLTRRKLRFRRAFAQFIITLRGAGVTFKENCPDIRNSKIVDIYKKLTEFGLQVNIYDL